MLCFDSLIIICDKSSIIEYFSPGKVLSFILFLLEGKTCEMDNSRKTKKNEQENLYKKT